MLPPALLPGVVSCSGKSQTRRTEAGEGERGLSLRSDCGPHDVFTDKGEENVRTPTLSKYKPNRAPHSFKGVTPAVFCKESSFMLPSFSGYGSQ